MKKKLVVLFAGAVLLASCNRNGSDNQMGTGTEVDSVECVSASEQVLTEKRFQELVASIPDHGIKNSPASSFTPEYYATLQRAWKIPDGGLGEIGNGEFLYYFVCGNDPCDTHSGQLKEVSVKGDTAFVKFYIVHEPMREPQKEQHSFKLVMDKGRWVIADYDRTLREMKDYLKAQDVYLHSKEYWNEANRILNDAASGEEWKAAVRKEMKSVLEYFQDLRPVACIGAGIYGGSRPKDVILANPLIVAMSPKESKSDLLWKVISYKVAFDKGDGKPLSHMIVDAPRFPEKVIGAIREASSGTQMIISDIKVRSDVGEFYAPDFTVTIK